jgi:hypothetical protein
MRERHCEGNAILLTVGERLGYPAQHSVVISELDQYGRMCYPPIRVITQSLKVRQ